MNEFPTLIRDMEAESRPREKAMLHGIKSLTDAELMAVIFATGIKGKSVLTLCSEMLRSKDGHLSQLARMTVKEICRQFKGIGPAKAISLLAALELGARSAADASAIQRDEPVNSSQRAYDLMRQHLERLDHEEFWAMLLSQNGRRLRQLRIGQGGLTATVVDIRQVIRAALECQASGMILFHNHPSGNLTPSQQDETVTRRIAEACRIFDLNLRDHLIVTDGSYYSFHDNGKL